MHHKAYDKDRAITTKLEESVIPHSPYIELNVD